jgi:uncharacterized protein (TIGR02996 family)
MTATINANPTRRNLLAAIAAAPSDMDLRRVFADFCEENGDAAEAARQRMIAAQKTAEGSQVVTVGRAGAGHDAYGNGIYTTKIYRAERRKDGVLTWRLAGSVTAHRTAGKKITDPMVTRAMEEAEGRGLPYEPGIRLGEECE